MKKGILLVIAALGLALFAVPDTPAQAWWWWHRGPDISLELFGSNFTTSSDDDGTPSALGAVSTSLQSGIAKGKSGRPIFSAQTVIEAAGADSRCGVLPGAGLSTTAVFTYKDGSNSFRDDRRRPEFLLLSTNGRRPRHGGAHHGDLLCQFRRHRHRRHTAI